MRRARVEISNQLMDAVHSKLEESKIPKRSTPGRRKSPGRTEAAADKSPTKSGPAFRSPGKRGAGRPRGARAKPAEPPVSPVRRKSRSPGRVKSGSPGRRGRRRSTESNEKLKQDDETVKRTYAVIVDSDSDVEVVQDVKEKSKLSSRSSSRKLDVDVDEDVNWKNVETTNNYTTRVTRRSLLSQQDFRPGYDYLAKKLTELSDDDDLTQLRKSVSLERSVEQKIIEFGGRWGVSLLLILLPFSAVALHIVCNRNRCSFSKLPDISTYAKFSNYFNLNTCLVYSALSVVLALLSALPFGGKKIVSLTTKQEKFQYRMNGLFSCLVILAAIFAMEIFKVPVFKFVYDRYFHFLIAAILSGLVLSLFVYVKSFYVLNNNALNSNALDNNLYGFFMGREVNPKLFGIIDLKIFAWRLLIVTSLILNTSILYKSIGVTTGNLKDFKNIFNVSTANLQPTILLAYSTQFLYLLDSLVFEPTLLSSFSIRYEGFGYMIAMGYAVYPFLITSITKYVYEYNVKLAVWQLILSGVLFLIGYILARGSNNLKNRFRRNPYSQGVAHLESVPTSQGKKLLVSGFWGYIRHPNYLGDIIITLSWCPLVLCVPPVLFIALNILILVHRAARQNVHCKIRYGPSWDRYCQKIKYKLIPKVY